MRYLLISILILNSLLLYSQNEKEDILEVSGMISAMPSFSFSKINKNWTKDFLLHNRFDITWRHNDWLFVDIGIRNRFISGDQVKNNPTYEEIINTDQGFIDMSYNYLVNNSYFYNSSIDRLALQVIFDKFEISIGRQRINWGITTAWNPNDIFNTYSFFDFDYTKRPGTDAVRIKYYSSFSSTIEIAANIDADKKINIAAYTRFTTRGTDIQLSGGLFKSEDYYLGAGCSSFVDALGIKGEASLYIPYKNTNKRNKVFISSLGLDYSFSNSLYLIIEGLYNSGLEKLNSSNLMQYMQSSDLDSRKMSFSPISLFASASYPISPILSSSMSGMYFPNINGFYFIPSIELSLSNNSHLSVIAQVFSGDIDKTALSMNSIFIRIATNF
jgi:hypothetical protein